MLEQLVGGAAHGQARSAAGAGDLGDRLQLVVGTRPAPKRSGREGGAGAAVAWIVLEQMVDGTAYGQARSAAGAGVLGDVLQLVAAIAPGTRAQRRGGWRRRRGQHLMCRQLVYVGAHGQARSAAGAGDLDDRLQLVVVERARHLREAVVRATPATRWAGSGSSSWSRSMPTARCAARPPPAIW